MNGAQQASLQFSYKNEIWLKIIILPVDSASCFLHLFESSDIFEIETSQVLPKVFRCRNQVLVLWSTWWASSTQDHTKENLGIIIVHACGWIAALLRKVPSPFLLVFFFFFPVQHHFSWSTSICPLRLSSISSNWIIFPSQLFLLCRPYRWFPTMARDLQDILATHMWGTHLGHTGPSLVKDMDRACLEAAFSWHWEHQSNKWDIASGLTKLPAYLGKQALGK